MALTLQLGCGQDHVVKGSCQYDNCEFDYIAAMDGHGTGANSNACISLMHKIDFDIVMHQPKPVDFIHDYLKTHNLANSGSTFTMARINKTKREIEVVNVGDSMTVVFKNGKIIYKTVLHNFKNLEEIERTKPLVQYIKPTKAPFPVNDNDVYLKDSNIGVWNNGEILVPTQSFGHNNMTGLDPSHVKIYYEPEDKMRVICATDGFWDMNMIEYKYLNVEDPQRLINITERKWKQQWMYYDGENPPVQTKFDSADDIGIAIWDSE
jgi:hypothetical protein